MENLKLEMLWERLNRDGEVGMTVEDFGKFQEIMFIFLAPGDSFRVERTVAGVLVTLN